MNLLREVAPDTKGIVDHKVSPNNEYVYLLQPVFRDGRVGLASMLDIKY